jgi:hypothetical protein
MGWAEGTRLEEWPSPRLDGYSQRIHRIIKAMGGRTIRPTLALGLVLLGLPAVAGAYCAPPEEWHGCKPPIESGKCGREVTEHEESERLYVQCLQSEREIHEHYEREIAEANRKYEERLHEIAEEQKRYEQQQAEAKYAREHPAPIPAPPPAAPAPTPPSITAFASSSSVKLSNGIGTITAGCGAPIDETCIFALMLVATVHGAHASAVKHVAVGTVTGSVQGGKSGKLTVKLNSRGRGYLRHNSLHLEAAGIVKSTAGLVTRISRHLTIKKK